MEDYKFNLEYLFEIEDDIEFILNPKENKSIEMFCKNYNLNLEEASLFLILLKRNLKNGIYVKLKDLCEENSNLVFGGTQYLKLLAVAKKLKEKNFITLKTKDDPYITQNLSPISPQLILDEDIFNEIVFDGSKASEVDYKDVYSIIEYLYKTAEKLSNNSVAIEKVFTTIGNIINRMHSSVKLKHYLLPYNNVDRLIVISTFYAKLMNESKISLDTIAKDLFEDDIKEYLKFKNEVLKKERKILIDNVVELEEVSETLITSADYKIVFSNKIFERIFDIKVPSLKYFDSKYLNFHEYKKFKSTLFLEINTEKEIRLISNAISKKKYNKIKKQLKKENFPQGIISLFHGLPGTGKTASIYQLAKESKRDILQVDISSIRDKYVGESEKKLKTIFEDYYKYKKSSRKTPILLFNEADALISQRINVNSSADSMNNSMQNILLEELENFDGILFATTNLIQSLDNAFDRRFLFKIRFENPSIEIRKLIWKNKIKSLKNEEIEEISKYELSGGQIENVSRIYTINRIIHDKNFSLKDLRKLCMEELQFRNDSTKKLGFL